MKNSTGQAAQYFDAMDSALRGLDTFLGDANSPLYKHPLIGRVVVAYVERLQQTFACWRNRIGFTETFRISRAESGFPVFQNVLELDNDRKTAEKRLAALASGDELRREMVDFILRQRAFPKALQSRMAERSYLETIQKGDVFIPFILPETIRVSVNAKTRRPYYVVHWGVFDGSQSLPMVYMATIEDSSAELNEMLVLPSGKMNPKITIPLPVEGLLNPDLAHRFDEFAEKNSAYSLTPVTIAGNLDKDFEELHPKQLRRFVLGPFYSAGVTEHNDRVSDILSKVRKADNAWMLTWTVQEVVATSERAAKRGLWRSTPARQEFHIETSDLEATRQGVSFYEKHALVPHDAYQALFADGDADAIFRDYKVHVISGNHITSGV
ncbi:hypothetical protein [Hoeflea prorocentri]|uniref:Uncharacterized protein n=1 Tax=Hoeflea prorocentri TaxID=1922333 RepID=A0A9X3UF74_9HYPH|nr:hypothetical protein [Hoeflea prorocentri]MCY6379509.1 hypothetical protein [Hoeflea prorocentri]MDA5397309.1 hypothetical protein [Hoeflea prorocentri]